jgi:hypothetical protein
VSPTGPQGRWGHDHDLGAARPIAERRRHGEESQEREDVEDERSEAEEGSQGRREATTLDKEMMMAKTTKKPKAKVKDLKPKKDPKGGRLRIK